MEGKLKKEAAYNNSAEDAALEPGIAFTEEQEKSLFNEYKERFLKRFKSELIVGDPKSAEKIFENQKKIMELVCHAHKHNVIAINNLREALAEGENAGKFNIQILQSENSKTVYNVVFDKKKVSRDYRLVSRASLFIKNLTKAVFNEYGILVHGGAIDTKNPEFREDFISKLNRALKDLLKENHKLMGDFTVSENIVYSATSVAKNSNIAAISLGIRLSQRAQLSDNKSVREKGPFATQDTIYFNDEIIFDDSDPSDPFKYYKITETEQNDDFRFNEEETRSFVQQIEAEIMNKIDHGGRELIIRKLEEARGSALHEVFNSIKAWDNDEFEFEYDLEPQGIIVYIIQKMPIEITVANRSCGNEPPWLRCREFTFKMDIELFKDYKAQLKKGISKLFDGKHALACTKYDGWKYASEWDIRRVLGPDEKRELLKSHDAENAKWDGYAIELDDRNERDGCYIGVEGGEFLYFRSTGNTGKISNSRIYFALGKNSPVCICPKEKGWEFMLKRHARQVAEDGKSIWIANENVVYDAALSADKAPVFFRKYEDIESDRCPHCGMYSIKDGNGNCNVCTYNVSGRDELINNIAEFERQISQKRLVQYTYNWDNRNGLDYKFYENGQPVKRCDNKIKLVLPDGETIEAPELRYCFCGTPYKQKKGEEVYFCPDCLARLAKERQTVKKADEAFMKYRDLKKLLPFSFNNARNRSELCFFEGRVFRDKGKAYREITIICGDKKPITRIVRVKTV